jgi:hypothetical protein
MYFMPTKALENRKFFVSRIVFYMANFSILVSTFSTIPCMAQPKNTSEQIIYLNKIIQTSKIINQKLVDALPRCKNLATLIDSNLKLSQSSYKLVLVLEKPPASEDKYLKKIGLSKTKYEQEAQDYLQNALHDMKRLKQLINKKECF